MSQGDSSINFMATRSNSTPLSSVIFRFVPVIKPKLDDLLISPFVLHNTSDDDMETFDLDDQEDEQENLWENGDLVFPMRSKTNKKYISADLENYPEISKVFDVDKKKQKRSILDTIEMRKHKCNSRTKSKTTKHDGTPLIAFGK